LLVIKHISGDDNEADIFTKNTTTAVFDKHVLTLSVMTSTCKRVGKVTSKLLSKEGMWEVKSGTYKQFLIVRDVFI
jgi:hypothetical protein